MDTTYVIGVDCATKHKNVGIALGRIEDHCCKVIEACDCKGRVPAEIIAQWKGNHAISLIALDAPLGWPISLGEALVNHQAGSPTGQSSECLFSRDTDRDITHRLGKRPLEVGANLIARTANSALDLLQELRDTTGENIPLAWEMGVPPQLSAIEVYPAATRLTFDHFSTTEKDGNAKRLELINRLSTLSNFSITSSAMGEVKKSGHVLDAVLCILAAREFIKKNCVPPINKAIAEKEGWIWAGKNGDPNVQRQYEMRRTPSKCC